MGVSKDTELSDLLMVILVKEVRAVDTVSDWIIRWLVDQEGFLATLGKKLLTEYTRCEEGQLSVLIYRYYGKQ